MAGVDISRISDLVRSTRATENYKGSWLDLVAQLRGYPLVSRFFAKRTEKSADRIKWRVAISSNPSAQSDLTNFHVGAYSQLQVAKGENLRELDVKLAKVRQAMAISKDEIILNQGGDTEEQLLDLYQEKLTHELDFPLLSKLEYALAGQPSSGTPAVFETFGLRYWLPAVLANGAAPASTQALLMNGGGDPVNYPNGAANLTVAAAPRWAHAIAGYNKVADDDLLGKMWEFSIRVNKFVPEGASAINSMGNNRVILCQTPVLRDWVHLQVVANDNPGMDLGRNRATAMFMSTPVEALPIIDTPASPLYSTTSGLLYNLDLDSFEYRVHPAWNFALEEDTKESTPDVKVLYRQAYHQLVCKDREKNFVGYTTNLDLIS